MIRILPVAFVLLLALPGCDTGGEQDLFLEQSRLPTQGFTETSADGEVLNEDPDDWRVAPFFANQVEVRPAVPNPVARNGLVTITVQDTFGDVLTGGVRVSGVLDTTPPQFVALDRDEGNGPFYELTFNPTLLRLSGGEEARLYRVRVFDSQSRIITYGDILVR